MGYIVRFFVPALFFFLVFPVPCLHAFSLGPIEVKSGFGDRFNAGIPLFMEDDSKVEVHIGTQEDYAKLGLDRPQIVDELEVKLLEGQGKNKTVSVVSGRPLFYPSFNLLIRAERPAAVILENYLVAVDFQQNVSLALKGKKEEDVPVISEPTEMVKEEKKLPEVSALPSAPEEVKTPGKPDSSNQVDLGAKAARGETTAMAPVSSARVKAEATPKPSGVLPQTTHLGKTYGPIQPGESLWKIAGNVSGSPIVARTAVALWMANKGKFLDGNIHGIKVGETLDLENLGKHLEGLSQSGAMEILQSQLKEWKQKLAPQQPVVASALLTEADNTAKPEATLDPDAIRQLLEVWRKSWEEGDLDRHMGLFSKENSVNNLSYAMWKGLKKRMFDRHKNVQITIEQPVIRQKKGGAYIVFSQQFHSDRMESFGEKTIDLVWSGSDWRIIGERFVPQKMDNKNQESPPPLKQASDFVPSNPQAEILQALEGWRKSWEEGDFERHMTYFSNQLVSKGNGKIVPYEVWRKIKRPMFDRYKNVEIRLESPVITPKADRWVVTCDQIFRSDALKSVGRKHMEFVREGKEWKIIKEEFKKAS